MNRPKNFDSVMDEVLKRELGEDPEFLPGTRTAYAAGFDAGMEWGATVAGLQPGPVPAYAIVHRTEAYRGDHGADVQMARKVIEGETVDALVHRVLDPKRPQDWLEIRVVKAEEGGS